MTAPDGKEIVVDGGVTFKPPGTWWSTAARVVALDEERQMVHVKGNGFEAHVALTDIDAAYTYNEFTHYAMMASVERMDLGGSGIVL